MFKLTEINRRRLQNFRANRRAVWSLRIFIVVFLVTLCAELFSNDKPFLVSYDGTILSPIFTQYPEERFGGDPGLVNTDYHDPVIVCLIRTAGPIDPCLDEADGLGEAPLAEGKSPGWMLWPLNPYSYSTVNKGVERAPSPPDTSHILGTDDQARDVLARVIYGFRLSVLFGFAVAFVSAIIGIFLGAIQGFFGGLVDLTLQRFEEIWTSLNELYVIMIIAAVLVPTPTILFAIFVAFSWTSLTGVVRAEFLRARNFEYVQAARALGVSDIKIMFRHILPNAMVATLTFLPFILTGSIGLLDRARLSLASASPPGYGPASESWRFRARSIRRRIRHLAITAFSDVRDHAVAARSSFSRACATRFDPRKTFALSPPA